MRTDLASPRHPLVTLALASALGATLLAAAGAKAAGTPQPSLGQRQQAARQTADTAAACNQIRPFYWEIGNRERALVAGARGVLFRADTAMPIASASKLVYAAWVGQQRAGNYTAEDIGYLTFHSGYTDFSTCRRGDSVHRCATRGSNDELDPDTAGKFYYGGGHMQQHADRVMGLGTSDDGALANQILTGLGMSESAADFSYTQPQLAGGINTTPRVYASFLRRLLDGSLALGAQLGSHAVCTNPAVCPGDAVYSPFPPDETPLYSLGHWVEDSTHSDGAFSSPGAFGFYPWIDRSKTWYGMVARVSVTGSGDPATAPYTRSMTCGRAIRRAWTTGLPQT